jgi:hypothetical protein
LESTQTLDLNGVWYERNLKNASDCLYHHPSAVPRGSPEVFSMRRIVIALAAVAFLCVGSHAQDDQPLGDLARQVRAQKQQKSGQAKDASSQTDDKDSAHSKASHVLNNDDDSEATALKSAGSNHSDSKKIDSADAKTSDAADPSQREADAEKWKSQIEEQKSAIAQLQQQIEQVSSSVHYTGANCVSGCEKWNEHQQQKQEQVETMKSQLQELQHHLEEMQDSARKQGFGSSVYEP